MLSANARSSASAVRIEHEKSRAMLRTPDLPARSNAFVIARTIVSSLFLITAIWRPSRATDQIELFEVFQVRPIGTGLDHERRGLGAPSTCSRIDDDRGDRGLYDRRAVKLLTDRKSIEIDDGRLEPSAAVEVDRPLRRPRRAGGRMRGVDGGRAQAALDLRLPRDEFDIRVGVVVGKDLLVDAIEATPELVDG